MTDSNSRLGVISEALEEIRRPGSISNQISQRDTVFLLGASLSTGIVALSIYMIYLLMEMYFAVNIFKRVKESGDVISWTIFIILMGTIILCKKMVTDPLLKLCGFNFVYPDLLF